MYQINDEVVIKDTGKIGTISQYGTRKSMYYVAFEHGGDWYTKDEIEKFRPEIKSSGV